MYSPARLSMEKKEHYEAITNLLAGKPASAADAIDDIRKDLAAL